MHLEPAYRVCTSMHSKPTESLSLFTWNISPQTISRSLHRRIKQVFGLPYGERANISTHYIVPPAEGTHTSIRYYKPESDKFVTLPQSQRLQLVLPSWHVGPVSQSFRNTKFYPKEDVYRLACGSQPQPVEPE